MSYSIPLDADELLALHTALSPKVVEAYVEDDEAIESAVAKLHALVVSGASGPHTPVVDELELEALHVVLEEEGFANGDRSHPLVRADYAIASVWIDMTTEDVEVETEELPAPAPASPRRPPRL